MTRHYVILDPYHDYAVRFIEHLAQTHAMHPICVYTDAATRQSLSPYYPILQSDLTRLSVDLGLRSVAEIAADLCAHHDVAGVIPVVEENVARAATLSLLLGKMVNSPDVLHRFRNKFLLKEHLRRHHPHIRINGSRLVHSVADVYGHGPVPARFVLKPNDGSASRNIGFFSRHSVQPQVEAYLSHHRTKTIVMEEFIGGQEYMVNGQVGPDGRVDIYAVLGYERAPNPSLKHLFYQTRRVHQNTPLFASLAAYAEKVIRATGLTRSPFHMEVKVDGDGPCLIEVGARLAGHNNAFICNAMHDGGLDVFAMAAHDYLFTAQRAPAPFDWDFYNGHNLLYVHGIALRDERIHALHGLDDVEAIPSFYQWVIKPSVGGRVYRTRDLLTMPYSLILRSSGSLGELRTHAAMVRRRLRWNESLPWRTRVAGDLQIWRTQLASRALRASRALIGAESP